MSSFFHKTYYNNVIGGMIPDPPWPVREECARWVHVNLGDPSSYPLLNEMIKKLLLKFSKIVLGRKVPGIVTSGASESNLLALYYWRLKGKRRVIIFPHTHYSISKSAKILKLNKILVNDINELEKKLQSTDVIVATLGTTEEGLVDDIKRLRELAESRGAVIHIDAAYYGAIYRYSLKREIPIDEVSPTIAVDLHKIPEAPPPAGILFTYNNNILDSLYFDAPYIPSKKQFGILGTRQGCVIPASLKAISIVYENWINGPRGLARSLEREIIDIEVELTEKGYMSHGGPAPIRCLTHPRIPEILLNLERSGFHVYTCHGGRGIRLVAMPHHIWKGYYWLIEVLSRARHGVLRDDQYRKRT